MLILRPLNIMVGQKIRYNDKARSLVQKAHVSQKIVLYFKGVTVNAENYSQRSRFLHLRDKQHKQFSTHHKEKPTRKKNRKEKAREVTITSEDYKIFLYISENYNQQSRSLYLKKLQSAKPFFT